MSNRKTKLSLKEERNITHALSMYLNAGLSLTESVQIIEEQSSKKLKEALIMWRIGIEEGKPITAAIDASNIKITDLTRITITLGERTGTLADSLRIASEQLENQIATRKKIASVLAYPALVFLGTLGLVLGLLLFVFPKIIPLFVTLKVSLPLSTRILISTTSIIQTQWLLLCISMWLLIGFFFLVPRVSFLKKISDFIYLRIPFVGGIIKARLVSQVFDSVAALMSAGESLPASLMEVSKMIKNHEYQRVILQAGSAIEQGKALSEFLREYKRFFPLFVPNIVSVGERTGNIEPVIRNIADLLKTELDDKLRVVTAAIEPVVMIVMSVLIGFIAISIILPIYGITSHFQNV